MGKTGLKLLVLGFMFVASSAIAYVVSQNNETVSQCCPTCQTPQAIQCRAQEAQNRLNFKDSANKPGGNPKAGGIAN